ETTVGKRQEVLAAVGKLAAPIRTALGDATPESLQLAAAETFTAGSLEAAHEYAVGQNLRFGGRPEEAIQHYVRAIDLDPNFATAYAGLALTLVNLGQRQTAQKYFEAAMARADRMSDREKYRNRGVYYLAVKNYPKAIEEYTALIKQY